MKLGLALGGGGVRGVAHVGVIKALKGLGYSICGIAGTSVGSVVGALYCSGRSIEQIEKFFQEIDQSLKYFSHGADEGPALLGLRGLTDSLRHALGNICFEDLELPFVCTAVDLNKAVEVVFDNGSVLDAVLASIAVPGVFPPKQINDHLLIDGSILDPVPVALARRLVPGGTPVFAVCLSPVPEKWDQIPLPHPPQMSPLPQPIIEQFSKLRFAQAIRIFIRAMEINSLALTEIRLASENPEIILRPDVHKYSMLDKIDVGDIVKLGVVCVEAQKTEIARIFSIPARLRRYFKREAPLIEERFIVHEEKRVN